ncbi:ATP-binding cassette domain-containing protein [Corynebacterium sp. UMB8791]
MNQEQKEKQLFGQPVSWAFGLAKPTLIWVIFSWGVSFLQGFLMVLPAKGLELALAGYAQGNIDTEDVILFIAFTVAGPASLFISQLVTLKANIVHLSSLFSTAVEELSSRGAARPDPDRLQSRLMNDGGALVDTWRSLPNTVFSSIAAFSSAFVVLDDMTVDAMIIIGTTSLCAILSSKWLANKSSLAWKDNMDCLASFSKTMRQRFVPDFADVVEAAAAEQWANQRTQTSANSYFRTSARQSCYSSITTFVPSLINHLSPAFILLWYLYFAQQNDIASTVAVMTFATLVARPLSSLGDCFEIVKRGSLARETLGSLFHRRDFHLVRGSQEVLNPPNGLVRVTGPSGSGKSTYLKSTILDPDRKISGQIGYCPQTNVFLDGTVAENVAMGRNIPAKEIDKVLDALGITSELQARGGSQTHIDGSGTDISGGQGRRISLARAIIGTPLVIALDEPLSGLDNDNANRARALLSDLAVKYPFIEVSHQGNVIDLPAQTIEVGEI